ncbi:MAG: class I SAM-dependent methyltransferase [Candidatus Aenigmarchaeota archaeon]|nr:class I SAM-dependent methyltransferase [Candidatus Aenigmarchaeota archaeon]MDW8149388.1 class I SAM-dependent methyltransferase [Candidatus Aenigmarchaeota archaeon]
MVELFFGWIKINKKDKILDVGCFDGSRVNYLNKIIPNIAIGIDIDKKALLTHRFENLICADLLNLPFKKSVFNKVICAEVLEHVENDDIALKNIKHVLKRNGLLFLSTPRHIKFFDIWDPAWLKWKLIKRDCIHRHYSIKDLIKKLKKHGFETIKIEVLHSYCWLFTRWLNVILRYIVKSKHQIKYEKIKKGKFNIFILCKLKK